MSKTIVITGATSGIGFYLAKFYLNLGEKVVITGRSRDKLDKATEKLLAYPNLLEAKLIDVTDEEGMREYLYNLDKDHKIDMIIANAGVSAGISNIQDISELARNIFDINVYGVFNTVHPLLNIMKERRKGHIVLVSSMSAFFGMKSAIFYASSKATIKSYGEGLRLLMKDYNVDVTTIFPGFVDSNITKANKFKMPFFMSTSEAVKIIAAGLEKKKGYIIFPLRMRIVVYLISILPFFIREVILEKLPNK